MPQRSRSNRSNSRSSDHSMMGHWTETAKDNPVKTAAAAAGAVAAGVFLWSKRNEISRLSEQVTDWADEMRSGSHSRELAMTAGPNESSAIESSRATGSRSRRSTGKSSRTSGARSSGQSMNAGRSSAQATTH